VQAATPHWRIVNADEAISAGRIARGASGFLRRARRAGENRAKNA
jgi:hypothetical protein